MLKHLILSSYSQVSEWVTLINTSWFLLPYIVFKATHEQKCWFDRNVQISSLRINCSTSGCSTDEIGLDWLKDHFIPHTTAPRIGKYCLLILDRHGNHFIA